MDAMKENKITRCKTCLRHVENNEDFPSMTVSDFSTDTKGDQFQECGMYIEDRPNEEDKP